MLWLVPLIILLLFIILCRGRGLTKRISFVGPRGSGKTRSIFKICMNEDVRTVPTLRDYRIKYKNMEIHEKPPRNSSDPYIKYSLQDKKMKFFFFINSADDICDFSDVNVSFVYFGDKDSLKMEDKRHDVIFLQGCPEKIFAAF